MQERLKAGVKVWNLNRKKMGTADSVFLRRYSSYGSLSRALGDMYEGRQLTSKAWSEKFKGQEELPGQRRPVKPTTVQTALSRVACRTAPEFLVATGSLPSSPCCFAAGTHSQNSRASTLELAEKSRSQELLQNSGKARGHWGRH